VQNSSMQYDLIRGQGHKPFRVGNPAVFESYLFRHLQWELATELTVACFYAILNNIVFVVKQTVQNELTRIEKRCKEMESHQRRLYRKMLGTAGAEAEADKHDVSTGDV